MSHLLRRWFVRLALTAGVLAAPRPTSLSAQEPAKVEVRPPAYVLPPVGDAPVPVHLRPDPLLERPEGPIAGPYFDAEAVLDFVHLRNQPRIPVVLSPVRTDIVQFPGNRLDDTVMPRVEAGFRLPDGLGAVEIGYRFLTTQGGDTITSALSATGQQGRLDLNVVDLTYISREYSLEPNWDMSWSVGGRFASLYFDSRANVLNPGTAPGSVLAQSETNSVWSLGVTAGLELDRKLALPGLAVFGRIEGASMYGRIKQTGTEQVVPGAGADSGLTRVQTGVSLPSLEGMVGLSYAPPGWNHSRLLLGYQYEVWWQVGRVADSRATLEDQGIVLRVEVKY